MTEIKEGFRSRQCGKRGGGWDVQGDVDSQELPVLKCTLATRVLSIVAIREATLVSACVTRIEILGSSVCLEPCIFPLLGPPIDHPKWRRTEETKQTRYSRDRVGVGDKK